MFGVLWLGTPIKAIFGNHFCICCGNKLKLQKYTRVIEKGSKDDKYYNYEGFGNFNVVWKKFHCSKCGKNIECTTQLSYESHKKRDKKTYKTLLYYLKPELIRRMWIDKNGVPLDLEPYFDDLESDSTYNYIYLIDYKNQKYQLPLSRAYRVKLCERPYRIKKDKNYKTCMKNIKKFFFK